MEDFNTLAKLHPDDVSTHAVSLAVLAWALNDAYESGGWLDREAFHRAADLPSLSTARKRSASSSSMRRHACWTCFT